jgi:hypothetical protein
LNNYFIAASALGNTRLGKLTDIYELNNNVAARPTDLILGINMIRIPEMYYIMAEAMLEEDNEAALAYYNEVRTHRGLQPLETKVVDGATGEMVSGPDIVTRGFVYVREAETLIDEIREAARRALENCCRNSRCDWATMKSRVRDDLSRMLFQKTKRSPMILPIIMEV